MLSRPCSRILCRDADLDEDAVFRHSSCLAALGLVSDGRACLDVQIALGRSKLEPLAVLAALCGPPAEILSMDLHPLKELLPRQALRTAAERICITAVNQVRALETVAVKNLKTYHDESARNILCHSLSTLALRDHSWTTTFLGSSRGLAW